jgi:hypothetical protein
MLTVQPRGLACLPLVCFTLAFSLMLAPASASGRRLKLSHHVVNYRASGAGGGDSNWVRTNVAAAQASVELPLHEVWNSPFVTVHDLTFSFDVPSVIPEVVKTADAHSYRITGAPIAPRIDLSGQWEILPGGAGTFPSDTSWRRETLGSGTVSNGPPMAVGVHPILVSDTVITNHIRWVAGGPWRLLRYFDCEMHGHSTVADITGYIESYYVLDPDELDRAVFVNTAAVGPAGPIEEPLPAGSNVTFQADVDYLLLSQPEGEIRLRAYNASDEVLSESLPLSVSSAEWPASRGLLTGVYPVPTNTPVIKIKATLSSVGGGPVPLTQGDPLAETEFVSWAVSGFEPSHVLSLSFGYMRSGGSGQEFVALDPDEPIRGGERWGGDVAGLLSPKVPLVQVEVSPPFASDADLTLLIEALNRSAGTGDGVPVATDRQESTIPAGQTRVVVNCTGLTRVADTWDLLRFTATATPTGWESTQAVLKHRIARIVYDYRASLPAQQGSRPASVVVGPGATFSSLLTFTHNDPRQVRFRDELVAALSYLRFDADTGNPVLISREDMPWRDNLDPDTTYRERHVFFSNVPPEATVCVLQYTLPSATGGGTGLFVRRAIPVISTQRVDGTTTEAAFPQVDLRNILSTPRDLEAFLDEGNLRRLLRDGSRAWTSSPSPAAEGHAANEDTNSVPLALEDLLHNVACIQRTWGFSPTIPVDGSFEADMVFRFYDGDLAHDPCLDIARLVVIGLDPVDGVARRFATVVDPGAGTATAHVNSLMPYYTLGTFAPFGTHALAFPALSGPFGKATRFSLVKRGRFPQQVILEAREEDGREHTDAGTNPVERAVVGSLFSSSDTNGLFAMSGSNITPGWIQATVHGPAGAAGCLLLGEEDARYDALPVDGKATPFAVLADVQLSDSIDTTLYVVNPTAHSNTIQLQLRSATGALEDETETVLDPRSRVSGPLALRLTVTNRPFQGYALVSGSADLVAGVALHSAALMWSVAGRTALGGVSSEKRYVPGLVFRPGTDEIDINVVNPTTNTVDVVFHGYLTDGTAIGSPTLRVLGPRSQLRSPVRGVLTGLPSSGKTHFTLEMTPEDSAVIGHVVLRDTSAMRYRCALPFVREARQTVCLPHSPHSATWSTRLGAFNAQSATATVEVRLYDAAGGLIDRERLTVAPGRTYLDGLGGLGFPVGDAAAYLRMESTVPLYWTAHLLRVDGNARVAMPVRETPSHAGLLYLREVQGGVHLTWPDSVFGYALKTAQRLGANTPWTDVTAAPAIENGENSLVVSPASTTCVYRLAR